MPVTNAETGDSFHECKTNKQNPKQTNPKTTIVFVQWSSGYYRNDNVVKRPAIFRCHKNLNPRLLTNENQECSRKRYGTATNQIWEFLWSVTVTFPASNITSGARTDKTLNETDLNKGFVREERHVLQSTKAFFVCLFFYILSPWKCQTKASRWGQKKKKYTSCPRFTDSFPWRISRFLCWVKSGPRFHRSFARLY